jgi:hypothetical protein
MKRTYTYFVAQIIPFVSAGVIVAVLTWALGRVSFAMLDSAGRFCSPAGELREVSWTEPIVFEHKLSSFCGPLDIKLPEGEYEIVTNYWPFWRELPNGELVRVKYPPTLFAVPFRRVMGENWYVIVAKIGSRGDNETILSSTPWELKGSTWQEKKPLHLGPSDTLYFYVNDIVLPLPYVYDWFYQGYHDTAQIMITKKR